MNLKIDCEWLLRMAEKEDNGITSVGGLFAKVDETMDICRGCHQPIDPKNFGKIADGCPCNSPRGINHGLVPVNTCTCKECDPEQTGSVRQSWRDRPQMS